jgi:isopropylmalate/homocitrate/citramalate synthase
LFKEGFSLSEKNSPWMSDQWWGSSYNWVNEIRSEFEFANKIGFHDATLRDGEQCPGVVFRKEAKVEIARMLDSVGINRIEAGMPTVSDEDFEAIKEIVALNLKADIMLFCRAHPADIEKAVETKADGLIIEVPSGFPRIKNQFPGWTYDDVKKKAIEGIKYAKAKGFFVTFFPYDTTRAEPEFLESLYRDVCEQAKPDSVAIVDTIGMALPQTIYYMVKKVKSWVNVPVEIHTHNDYGMGVATSLAGIQAGAEVVHGCMTGLGERTGNASLEQIIIGMKTLLGLNPEIDFSKIYSTCKRISELSKVPIPINEPFTGDVAFAREIGLGAKLFNSHPTTIFPLNPALLGREPKIVLGKKSGKDTIKIKLEELKLSANEESISDILNDVKLFSIEKGTYLTNDEFVSIVQKYNC